MLRSSLPLAHQRHNRRPLGVHATHGPAVKHHLKCMRSMGERGLESWSPCYLQNGRVVQNGRVLCTVQNGRVLCTLQNGRIMCIQQVLFLAAAETADTDHSDISVTGEDESRPPSVRASSAQVSIPVLQDHPSTSLQEGRG